MTPLLFRTELRAQEKDAPLARPSIRLLKGHTGPVHDLRFTPDGRKLISVSGWPGSDNSVRIWDVASGRELHRLSAPGQAASLELSPDGQRALVGALGGLLLVNVESGEIVRSIQAAMGPVPAVAFARDGRHVYSASHDGFARRWDLDTGEEVGKFRVPNERARFVAELPDGRLITADSGRVVQLWNIATGQELRRIETSKGWLTGARLTPDNKQILLANWNAFLLDLKTGEIVRTFEGHKAEVLQMNFSPDKKQLLTANFDGTVRLWDFEKAEPVSVLSTQDELVFSAVFSPDGRFVAAGGGGRREGKDFRAGSDHAIRIIDLEAAAREKTLAVASPADVPRRTFALPSRSASPRS